MYNIDNSNEYKKLINELKQLISDKRKMVIALDGNCGAGKTTLSKRLSASLEIPTVSVDDYLNRNLGYYIDALKYDDFKHTIESLKDKSYIIEGCCLLMLLNKLNVDRYTLLYLKKISNDYWSEGMDLDAQSEEDYDCIIKDLKEMCEKHKCDFIPKKELIDYHYCYKPHNKCDFCLMHKE